MAVGSSVSGTLSTDEVSVISGVGASVSTTVGSSVPTFSGVPVGSTKFAHGSVVPEAATPEAEVGTTLMVVVTFTVGIFVVTVGVVLLVGAALSPPDRNVQPALHNNAIRMAAQIPI